MLPLVDEKVLQNNPQFKSLYLKLVDTALNPDGSSKTDPAAKQRAAVKKDVDIYRFKHAKHHLLSTAIASTTPPSDPKPSSRTAGGPRQHSQTIAPSEDLLDVLLILPALLDAEHPPTADAARLLFAHPPLSEMEPLLPDLARLASATLRSSALNLTRILHPSTNPSYLHRHIASLALDFSALLAARADLRVALLRDRLRALADLADLLDLHGHVLAALVRALEGKHTVTARSLTLSAGLVSAQAQRTAQRTAQARGDIHRELYSEETVAALQHYMMHLKDAKIRTAERTKGLKAELGEFGVGTDDRTEEVMTALAKEYARLGRERKEVRGDLERLQDS